MSLILILVTISMSAVIVGNYFLLKHLCQGKPIILILSLFSSTCAGACIALTLKILTNM